MMASVHPIVLAIQKRDWVAALAILEAEDKARADDPTREQQQDGAEQGGDADGRTIVREGQGAEEAGE